MAQTAVASSSSSLPSEWRFAVSFCTLVLTVAARVVIGLTCRTTLPNNTTLNPVRRQRTGSGLSNWTLMALDPNVYSPEDWNGGTNVYILADLGSLGPVTTTAPPKGMFYDGKFRKVYLTVDNMLVEVDIGAITNVFPPTGPIAPTVIVNTSNIAANPTAPSPEIDNLDRAFARLNQPQGIAGRLFFQPSTPESTDEPCVSDQGCLVVADTGSHRIRLVDMSPSGGVGVFTAVGDGNLMCDPGSYDTSSPESFDETVLAGAMPCSRDGFVLPSIEDWWMNGGWDNYPFNVPADVPVADVDSPMQLFIDAADNFNPESGPSFHVWMTEKTSKGTFIKVLGQNGEIRTIAEMSTIEPKVRQGVRCAMLLASLDCS